MNYNHLLLSITFLYLCTGCGQKASAPTPHIPTAIVATAEVQSVAIYRDYPGHIQAYNSVAVQTQIAGQLTGMYFSEGDTITAGQLLFTIDSRPYKAALDKAEAALAKSIASLRYAEETATRYSKLIQDDYVAKLQYDQYLTNVLVEESAVVAAKAEVETAKLNLSYTTIYSPITGIAGKKQIDVGNYVSVAENPSLIVINQVDPVYASFYVPDIDFPAIWQGQKQQPLKVEVHLNENEKSLFDATLTLIDNRVDPNTGSIFMKATLCNQNHQLWPGQFISARVILAVKENAILVPYQAVQIGPSGHFLFTVSDDDIVAIQPVSIGQRHGDKIVIEKGLIANRPFVVEGQLNLYEGARVRRLSKTSIPEPTNNDSVNIQ